MIFFAAAKSTLFDFSNLSSLTNPFLVWQEPFYMLAFLVFVAGLGFSIASHKGELDRVMFDITKCGLGVLFAASVTWLWPLFEDIFYFFPDVLFQQMGGMNSFGDNVRALAMKRSSASVLGGGTLMIGLPSVNTFIVWLLSLLAEVLSVAASFITVPMLVTQKGLLFFIYVFVPIPIAVCTLPKLSHLGVQFLLFSMSVFLWPMGIAIATGISSIALTGFLLPDFSSTDALAQAVFYCLSPIVACLIQISLCVSVPVVSYYLCAMGGAAVNPSSGLNQIGHLAGNAARLFP